MEPASVFVDLEPSNRARVTRYSVNLLRFIFDAFNCSPSTLLSLWPNGPLNELQIWCPFRFNVIEFNTLNPIVLHLASLFYLNGIRRCLI